MKKVTAILLSLAMVLCLVACSAKDNNKTDAPAIESALVLLDTVWQSYADDEKFPVAGGDFSEENASMEGPGKYSIEDAEMVDSALGFPAGSIDKIDDAASLSNMMNANNFTCGAYHLVDASSSSEVVDAVKQNISTRQWMCGFPEKLIIATLGDYVIVAFGSEELISPFTAKLQAAYPDTQIACDEPIA